MPAQPEFAIAYYKHIHRLAKPDVTYTINILKDFHIDSLCVAYDHFGCLASIDLRVAGAVRSMNSCDTYVYNLKISINIVYINTYVYTYIRFCVKRANR